MPSVGWTLAITSHLGVRAFPASQPEGRLVVGSGELHARASVPTNLEGAETTRGKETMTRADRPTSDGSSTR